MTNRPLSLSIKVHFKNGRVRRLRTRSWIRFLRDVRTIKWDKGIKYATLRVSYGKGFHNEGDYENKQSFWLALNAFTEEYYGATPEMVAVLRKLGAR